MKKNEKNSQLSSLKKLADHIHPKRKKQFLILLIITIFAGIIEIVSIYSIIPFISIVTNENYLFNDTYLSKFININNKNEAVLIFGIVFSLFYIFNSILRIFIIYITERLSKITTAELSINIYKSILYDSYEKHILRNPNSIISAVTQKVYEISTVLSGIINIISGTFFLLCIISVLIAINPQVMIISMIFFTTLYFIITLSTKKKIYESSEAINSSQNNIVKNLQNGLGAIRDIILDKTQNFYMKLFKKESFLLAKKSALVEFIQNSPRHIFEALGLSLFVILLIYWNETKTNEEFLLIFPTLAALAIGAQRILPLLNVLYANATYIKSNYYQINEVQNILSQYSAFEKKNMEMIQKNINFENLISFKNVSYSYDGKKNILEDINFEIKKGLKVGIIGKTGEGKSTFLDLLMGLLEPQKGSIYIDDNELSKITHNSWQSKISHVPQKIFLSNNSFMENIAFGKEKEKIDIEEVKLAAKKSQIHEFIMQSEGEYNKSVGEQGIKLSGGQIQRIGLARALYKKVELIIFDEATNSLDEHTEQLVMKELNNIDKNITLIIVTHRLNTLKDCDLIFEIKDQKVIQIEKV